MGSFDSVHVGDRCGQTKALGRRNGNVLTGDRVELMSTPMNEEQDQAEADGTWPGRPEQEFGVVMPEGGYLVVGAGILGAWSPHAPTDLPLFDYLGYPVGADDDPSYPDQLSDGRAEAADCSICEAVRAGLGPEFRAEQRAQVEAMRADARARRARATFRSV